MASLITKKPYGQPEERVVMDLPALRAAFPNVSWMDGAAAAVCVHGDRYITLSIGGQVPEGMNFPGMVYGTDEIMTKYLMLEIAMRIPNVNVVCVRKAPTIITTTKLVLNDFDFDYPQLEPKEFSRITTRLSFHP